MSNHQSKKHQLKNQEKSLFRRLDILCCLVSNRERTGEATALVLDLLDLLLHNGWWVGLFGDFLPLGRGLEGFLDRGHQADKASGDGRLEGLRRQLKGHTLDLFEK